MPVVLNTPNKVVYSVHAHPSSAWLVRTSRHRAQPDVAQMQNALADEVAAAQNDTKRRRASAR